MSLKIFVDHAQRRLWKHRIGVTVAGAEWIGGVFNNVWREVVTNTLMLKPFCLTDEWSTNSAGDYARWALSDFDLDTSDGWGYKSDKDAGQNRMFNASPMADPAILSTALPINQGIWISFFNFNEGDREQIVLECGWSNTGDGYAGVSLRFYAGGRVEVWKDGIKRGEEQLNGISSRNNANKYVNLMLLPFRKRELLVYSHTAGGGFTFLFDEIPETEVNPVIVPGEKFWFQSIIAPDMEVAPLRFPESGTIISPRIVFGDIPGATRTIENFWNLAHPLYAAGTDAVVYGDKSYHGSGGTEGLSDIRFVTLGSDTTTFVPNGVLGECRLRCQLDGNGLSTPFLYGLHRAFKAEYELTSDTEVEVSEFICSPPEWTVPDSANGVNFRLEFDRLEELEDLAPKITKIKNRPVRIELDGITVLDGTLSRLQVKGDLSDRRLHCEANDFMAMAEKCQMPCRIPFDGMPFCRPLDVGMSAIGFLASYYGRPDSRIDLDDAGFNVPYIPGPNAEDFQTIGENGDTVYRCMEKLFELYAKGWMWGEEPRAAMEPITYCQDAINFPDDPFKTLECEEYDSPTIDDLEIEANEVRVTGLDPRNETALQSFKKDTDSQDPTTNPSLRPDNWLGFPLLVGVLDGRFTSSQSADQATELLFGMATQSNSVVEVPCQLIQNGSGLPVWRRKKIGLSGFEVPQPMVTSFQCVFEDESETDVESGEDPIFYRPASYTGGTMYNQGGQGLRDILNNARIRAQDRALKGSKSEKVLGAIVAKVKVL